MLLESQKRALTRSARRALRKAHLPEEFIMHCRVWDAISHIQLGNFILYGGKFSRKDKKRLQAIWPHVAKSLHRTKTACGFRGEIVLDSFLTRFLSEDRV
jgi:hypothetical protein